jgi:hypothetical protein
MAENSTTNYCPNLLKSMNPSIYSQSSNGKFFHSSAFFSTSLTNRSLSKP